MITQIPGHATDIDDVILNFTGSVLGYLLFLAIQAGWKAIAKNKPQANS